MKAIIFAGGLGTRLWPLSRRSSPKQFEKVVGDKSTLQLAVDRLQPDFRLQDIFVFTGERYVDNVKGQLPEIPGQNIIGEPAMRDVGPAVGLAMSILVKDNPQDPVAILWSDHIVGQQEKFRRILHSAGEYIKKNPMRIVFIGQKPRFASQNLGWIEYGKAVENIKGIEMNRFKCFHYRPEQKKAEEFLQSGHHVWNIGYFVTTPKFLWNQYKMYASEMYGKLNKIRKSWNTNAFPDILKEIYPTLRKSHFDNIILEKIDPEKGLVIAEDLKWSDIGAWEALKEALQTHPDQNVIQGRVLTTDCKDSLVYNYTDQLVVAIDVNGMLVVNTNDVVLVCHKNSVPKIKTLVKELAGTENKHLV